MPGKSASFTHWQGRHRQYSIRSRRHDFGETQPKLAACSPTLIFSGAGLLALIAAMGFIAAASSHATVSHDKLARRRELGVVMSRRARFQPAAMHRRRSISPSPLNTGLLAIRSRAPRATIYLRCAELPASITLRAWLSFVILRAGAVSPHRRARARPGQGCPCRWSPPPTITSPRHAHMLVQTSGAA